MIDATSPHTPVRHRRHTSDLTHHVCQEILYHESGVTYCTPMGGQSCPHCRPHMPSACPPARSQSHVMFHNSARADVATRSNPTRPVAVPRSNLLAPACACSTSVNITPLQRPVAPPGIPISREPVTRGAHARHRLRPGSHLVLPERLRASCPFLRVRMHHSMHASGCYRPGK